VRCERGLSLLLAAAEEGDALCERQTVGESQVNAEAQRRCLCNRVISTGAREQGRGETDGRAGVGVDPRSEIKRTVSQVSADHQPTTDDD